MAVFFTADTHFFHTKIITYCDRPFSNSDEMNEVMIERWNERIKPGDLVYHLGDLVFGRLTDEDKVKKLLRRLNGQKQLIYGNHDGDLTKRVLRDLNDWSWQGYYKRVKVNKQAICLFHYSMRVWDGSHRGVWSLYGHSHGELPTDKNAKSFDIGVDCHDFYPVPFEGILGMMEDHSFVRPHNLWEAALDPEERTFHRTESPGSGKYYPETPEYPEHWPHFSKSEEIEIKGHKFTVDKIDSRDGKLIVALGP